jgi:hypothetical protein
MKKFSREIINPLLHEHHERPKTRRQFLAQGMTAGLGYVAMPTLASLIAAPGRAWAECSDSANINANKLPFICLDLAGGANLAGSNMIVGGAGGQLDLLPVDAYARIGLQADITPDKAGQLDAINDLSFHVDSALLRGMRSRASAATLVNVNGSIVCARSNNDTGNNPHNPIHGICAAGALGQLVNSVGNRDSNSGGRSDIPQAMAEATYRPVKVDRASDARSLVDAGKAGELFGDNADRVMQAIEAISAAKLDAVAEEQAVEELIQCAYMQSRSTQQQFNDPSSLDPELDANIQAIFRQEELDEGPFRRTASVMKLVCEGYAGAGTIELGGYDYHGGTRSRGELKDFEAGECLGAIFEYCARINSPVMVYLITDGSLDSRGSSIDDSVDGRGKLAWRGDNESTAAVAYLWYDPNGAPQLVTPTASQIGYFSARGSVDDTSNLPITDNVNSLAEACVANYLAARGELALFNQILPNNTIGGDLEKLVAIQPFS